MLGGVGDINYKMVAGVVLLGLMAVSVIAGIIVSGTIFIAWTAIGLAIGLGLGWARKAG